MTDKSDSNCDCDSNFFFNCDSYFNLTLSQKVIRNRDRDWCQKSNCDCDRDWEIQPWSWLWLWLAPTKVIVIETWLWFKKWFVTVIVIWKRCERMFFPKLLRNRGRGRGAQFFVVFPTGFQHRQNRFKVYFCLFFLTIFSTSRKSFQSLGKPAILGQKKGEYTLCWG